jgi:hypothetical protein
MSGIREDRLTFNKLLKIGLIGMKWVIPKNMLNTLAGVSVKYIKCSPNVVTYIIKQIMQVVQLNVFISLSKQTNDFRRISSPRTKFLADVLRVFCRSQDRK